VPPPFANDSEETEWCIAETQAGRPRPFIEKFLWIRDEQDRLVPLRYNRIQADYDQRASSRNIKVKPRKIGFTTQEMAEMYAYAVTMPNFQGIALTYDAEETNYLFGMIHLFHEMLSPALRPKTSSHTATGINFEASNSRIEVQTAGGGRKGRGRTPSRVLIDELAQYDERVQDDIWTAIVNSTPISATISAQSTPKGIGNKFHSEFVRAVDGQSRWEYFFYPWMWLSDKHSLQHDSPDVRPEDRGAINYTEEEHDLVLGWNREHPENPIGEDNVRWRRMKISEDPDSFRQEFPEDSISCFLATTETVFPTEELNRLVGRATNPIDTRLSGSWKIWRRPEAGRRYVIGVDCANGIVGGDNSSAVIGTVDGRVDAVVAGIYGQTEMAQIVYNAAQEYNDAFVLNERQNAFEFQRIITNQLGHRNIYHHREGMGFRPEHELPLGFPTTGGASGGKQRLIEAMRTSLRSDGFNCPDMETLRELVEYKQHRDGSYGAPVGRHDDRAMAAMLYLVGVGTQPANIRRPTTNQSRAAVVYPDGVLA